MRFEDKYFFLGGASKCNMKIWVNVELGFCFHVLCINYLFKKNQTDRQTRTRIQKQNKTKNPWVWWDLFVSSSLASSKMNIIGIIGYQWINRILPNSYPLKLKQAQYLTYIRKQLSKSHSMLADLLLLLLLLPTNTINWKSKKMTTCDNIFSHFQST